MKCDNLYIKKVLQYYIVAFLSFGSEKLVHRKILTTFSEETPKVEIRKQIINDQQGFIIYFLIIKQ